MDVKHIRKSTIYPTKKTSCKGLCYRPLYQVDSTVSRLLLKKLHDRRNKRAPETFRRHCTIIIRSLKERLFQSKILGWSFEYGTVCILLLIFLSTVMSTEFKQILTTEPTFVISVFILFFLCSFCSCLPHWCCRPSTEQRKITHWSQYLDKTLLEVFCSKRFKLS